MAQRVGVKEAHSVDLDPRTCCWAKQGGEGRGWRGGGRAKREELRVEGQGGGGGGGVLNRNT